MLADLREHGPSTAREIGQRGAALRQRLQLAPGKAYAVQSAHTRVLYILGFDGKMLRGRPSSWINGAYRYVDARPGCPAGSATSTRGRRPPSWPAGGCSGSAPRRRSTCSGGWAGQ